MALLKPGYWHDKYFPSRYWNEDYWQAFAAEIGSYLITPGYWHKKFWPKGYWDEDYWIQYGGPIMGMLVKAGYWHTTFWPRAFWAQDYWLEWGGPTGTGGLLPRGGYIFDDPLNVQEYGRRPYVGGAGGGGTGYFEQMKRTPDKAIFNEQLKRQSEFKKPYLEDDYQEMEYWYPYPPWDFNFGWPSFNWDDDGNIVNEGWVDYHTDNNPCPPFLQGFGIIYTCDKEYIYRLPVSSSGFVSRWELLGEAASDCEIISHNKKQVKIKCQKDSSGARFPKLIICYDLEGYKKKINQKCICTFDVINGCDFCKCISTAAPNFVEEGTSDTIAPNGVAALTIIDGCPPYTWSTSNNGYTITNPTTENLINTVSCVPAGVCGVDFDPVLTVQVTDVCGSSSTVDIRNTAGSWGAATNGCILSLPADSCTGNDSIGYTCTKTSGKYKQTQHITKTAGNACSRCCVPYDNSPTCSDAGGTWCDNQMSLAFGIDQCIMESKTVCPGTACFTCWYNLTLEYQEWTC
jgi:hypothetical protein